MKQRIVLIISIAVGLAAAILTRTYLATKDAEVTRQKQAFYARHGLMDVLCFGKDVPSGTVLARRDLGVKRVPASGLRGQALTEEDLALVLGRKIISGHKQGELLFWGDIEGGSPAAGGLANDIRKTMRAISINASGAAAVSGMIRPSDHVDVIGTFTFPGSDKPGREKAEQLVTCTILQNVLVLATGKETAKMATMRQNPLQASNAGYSLVTLEVTPREAEMLVFAEQIRGRLQLVLRNRNDTSFEKELPQVDFRKIREEMESLNMLRQKNIDGRR